MLKKLYDIEYRDPDHSYWYQGKRIISVTQSMSPYNPFTMVPHDVLAKAAARGTWVDAWVTAYLTEHSDLPNTPYPHPPVTKEMYEEYKLYVQSFLTWFTYSDIVTLGVQCPLYSKKHNYAGTMDWYGLIKGIPTVMDYKCTYIIPPSVGTQLSAYSNLIVENGNPCVNRRVLHITSQLCRMKKLEDPGDFNRFLSFLNVQKIIKEFK